MKYFFASVLALLAFVSIANAETITVATYNVELFHERFASTQPKTDTGKKASPVDVDKRLIPVAKVIQSPDFNPDIICLEECCEQDELDRFNAKWLKGEYATVIVFPTNSGRHQQLAMMLKPGFKVLERKDQYYLEKDSTTGNERGERLFARGPSFVLVQSPGGFQFWVGVTHEKSKFDNNLEVTKWRDREATRLHAILKEIEHTGKGNGDVLLCGDMNDEIGYQAYELAAGADSIALLVGPPQDQFSLITKPLDDAGAISYWRGRYKSLIDHMIVSKEMKPLVKEVKVFNQKFAQQSSDHYPVMMKFDTGK